MGDGQAGCSGSGVFGQVSEPQRVEDSQHGVGAVDAEEPEDLSQQQLADLVSVSRQTINAIEKGDYNPTIRLCISICRALGKTLDELFWEEEEQ